MTPEKKARGHWDKWVTLCKTPDEFRELMIQCNDIALKAERKAHKDLAEHFSDDCKICQAMINVKADMIVNNKLKAERERMWDWLKKEILDDELKGRFERRFLSGEGEK